MPKVEVEALSGGYTATVKLDGVEVPDVCGIQINIDPAEVVRAHISVNATESLRFEGDAMLFVEVRALPGFVVIQETVEGRTVYRCEPEVV